MGFSFDPGVILAIALSLGLYARAVRVLGRRGFEVPGVQQTAWYAGIALVAVGLVSPIDGLGEDLLSLHMAQHLLIADLAAPLILAGIRTPVLVFLLPRPVLVPLARMHRLRALFRFVRRPLVAIPIWVVTLYGWHLGFMFEGALTSSFVHALQHASFVVASLLVWWSAIEPKRGRMPGELWKAGSIVGARAAGMFLGVAFIAMRSQAYDPYGNAAFDYGLTPLQDQQIAGGMMLTIDMLVMLSAFAFFFWRAAQEHDRAERAAAATG